MTTTDMSKEMRRWGQRLLCPEGTNRRAHKLLALSQTAISAGYTSAFLWDTPGRFYGLINLDRRGSLVNAINYLVAYELSVCIL